MTQTHSTINGIFACALPSWIVDARSMLIGTGHGIVRRPAGLVRGPQRALRGIMLIKILPFFGQGAGQCCPKREWCLMAYLGLYDALAASPTRPHVHVHMFEEIGR